MGNFPDRDHEILTQYFGGDYPHDLSWIGGGTDGTIYLFPDRRIVLKVHESRERFMNELEIYRRLETRGVTEILGLNVPVLLDADEHLQVIEMSLVRPPFLLDFGKSRLDFQSQMLPGWEEEIGRMIDQKFERRAEDAKNVFQYLIRHFGIYHFDINPYNLNFGEDEGVD